MMPLLRISNRGGEVEILEDARSTRISSAEMAVIQTDQGFKQKMAEKMGRPPQQSVWYRKGTNGKIYVSYGESPGLMPDQTPEGHVTVKGQL